MNAKIVLKTATWNLLNQARAGKTDTRMIFKKLMIIDSNLYTTDGRIAVKVGYEHVSMEYDSGTGTKTSIIKNGVYDIGLVEKHDKVYTQVRVFKDANHDEEPIHTLPSFFEPFTNLATNTDCRNLTSINLNRPAKDLDQGYTSLICYAFQAIDKLNSALQDEVKRQEGIGVSISLVLVKKLKGFKGEVYFNKAKTQYYLKNAEVQNITLPIIL